jgi:ABC-type lipoprotein export system ATPase subunit
MQHFSKKKSQNVIQNEIPSGFNHNSVHSVMPITIVYCEQQSHLLPSNNPQRQIQLHYRIVNRRAAHQIWLIELIN